MYLFYLNFNRQIKQLLGQTRFIFGQKYQSKYISNHFFYSGHFKKKKIYKAPYKFKHLKFYTVGKLKKKLKFESAKNKSKINLSRNNIRRKKVKASCFSSIA